MSSLLISKKKNKYTEALLGLPYIFFASRFLGLDSGLRISDGLQLSGFRLELLGGPDVLDGLHGRVGDESATADFEAKSPLVLGLPPAGDTGLISGGLLGELVNGNAATDSSDTDTTSDLGLGADLVENSHFLFLRSDDFIFLG